MTQNYLLAAGLLLGGLSFTSCSEGDTHAQARELCDEYLGMVRSLDADAPVPEAVVDRAYEMISSADQAFIDASFAVYSKRNEAAWREHLTDPGHSVVEAVWFRTALEEGIVDQEAFRDKAMEIMLRYDFAVYNNDPIYGESRRLEPTVTEVTYGVPASIGASEYIGRPFNIAEEQDGELKIAYLKNIQRYNKALRISEAEQRRAQAEDAGYVDGATAMLLP